MPLRFISGCGDFQLEEADVQWHPGNLLARLTSTTPAHSEGGVSTWDLGTAFNTPFALPGALPLTVALFKSRGQPQELEFLSQLLAQFRPRDISSTLQILPDYLGLPGSPSDYLPAEDHWQIPLQHAGVLDLHVYPFASTVAQLIMDSLPFRRHSNSTDRRVKRLAGTQPRAARYLLCHHTVSRESPTLSADHQQQLAAAGFSSTEVVEVYQVHMPPGPWPPLPRSIPDYEVPSCCMMDNQSQFELLSALTVQGHLQAASLTSMGALFGEQAPIGLDRQTVLGGCVAAELEEALSKVAVQGSTGVAKLECIAAWVPPRRDYDRAYGNRYRCHTYCPLWTITW